MITLQIQSRRQIEMIDISAAVRNAIEETGIDSGLAVVFTPHTTAAITINENADPTVRSDILRKITELIPRLDGYQHNEGNSDAHIKSSLFGASETLIICGGKAKLGTWQGIFFCEFDGPRQRQVQIQVIGQ